MAILSDFEEDKPTKPVSPPKPFHGVLDPEKPLAFLEAALDFVSRESDLFKSDTVIRDVNALARTLKEKVDAELRKTKAKAEAEETKKTDAAAEAKKVADKEAKKVAMEAEKPAASSEKTEEEPSKDENSTSGKLVPNAANGLDMENYSWGQSLQEVTINVPVPPGTKSRLIDCDIKKDRLKVGLKGQPPVIDGELYDSVKVEDCFWSLEDQKTISVLLTKQKQMDWWKSLVKGGPEVDTQKVEPEASKISDLDSETRAVVEKMMFDQRRKQQGLPTSDEMEKHNMLKQFMSQHPEMDFANAKIM